jgi:hypothetical protein
MIITNTIHLLQIRRRVTVSAKFLTVAGVVLHIVFEKYKFIDAIMEQVAPHSPSNQRLMQYPKADYGVG